MSGIVIGVGFRSSGDTRLPREPSNSASRPAQACVCVPMYKDPPICLSRYAFVSIAGAGCLNTPEAVLMSSADGVCLLKTRYMLYYYGCSKILEPAVATPDDNGNTVSNVWPLTH